MARQAPLTFADVLRAAEEIKPFVHRTPVIASHYFNSRCGRNVYFKCENMQKTGSFKSRGCVFAVRELKRRDPDCRGVITHSSGNAGAALAYAAKVSNVPCTVVCPSNAPAAKVDVIKGNGAEVVVCGPNVKSRIETTEQLVASTGKVLIHPHDDYDMMAGGGTIAKELLEDVPELDAVLVPVGGGGMLAGMALYLATARPECKVYAVEPSGKKLADSLNAGKPLWADPPGTLDTVADGVRVERLGGKCFPVVLAHCQKLVFSMTNEAIINATKLVFERLKVVIEPTSGLGVAALLSEQFAALPPTIRNVGVILCGGNVDLDRLPWL